MEIKNNYKAGKSMANLMFAAYQVITGKSVTIISPKGRKKLSVQEAKKILNIL